MKNNLRNLSLRVIYGTKIFHNNGQGHIEYCIAEGIFNNVMYKGKSTTLNSFCIQHLKDTRKNISLKCNAWKNCYIKEIKEDNTGKDYVKHTKLYKVPFLTLDLPIISVYHRMYKNKDNIIYYPEEEHYKIQVQWKLIAKFQKYIEKIKKENLNTNNLNTNNLNTNNENINNENPDEMPRKTGLSSSTRKMIRNARKKPQNKTATKTLTKNKPTIETEEEKESRLRREKLKFKMQDYRNTVTRFWNNVSKEKVFDRDEYISVTFGFVKLKEERYGPNMYIMYTKNKEKLGYIKPWKDTKNEIPDYFKNKDNIVCHCGVIISEYDFLPDSPYHELPKKIYRKYRYDKDVNKLIETKEIVDADE